MGVGKVGGGGGGGGGGRGPREIPDINEVMMEGAVDDLERIYVEYRAEERVEGARESLELELETVESQIESSRNLVEYWDLGGDRDRDFANRRRRELEELEERRDRLLARDVRAEVIRESLASDSNYRQEFRDLLADEFGVGDAQRRARWRSRAGFPLRTVRGQNTRLDETLFRIRGSRGYRRADHPNREIVNAGRDIIAALRRGEIENREGNISGRRVRRRRR